MIPSWSGFPKARHARALLRLGLDYPKFTLRCEPLDGFAVRSATLSDTLAFEPRRTTGELPAAKLVIPQSCKKLVN